MVYNKLHKELMSKKSKYDKYRVDGWADSSESVLTKGQIEFLIQDEKRMQAAEIAEALKDSKKPFNSVHVQYETNDPNAKTKPVTDAELDKALYFIQKEYTESSPLTLAEREHLSTSYVGESKLTGDGLLRFMNDLTK